MTSIQLNADDFGFSAEINTAVKQAIEAGLVTSVSVMTTTPHFNEAVVFLKKNPEVKVGLHVNVTELDEQITPLRLLWSLLTNRLKLQAVEKQLTDQYQVLKKTGLPINHIDSHEHIHLYPPLYTLLHTFAKKNAIQNVRNTPFSVAQLKLFFAVPIHLKMIILWLAYGVNDLLLPKKYKTTKQFLFDFNWHNHTTHTFLENVLSTAPADTAFICHLSTAQNDDLSKSRYRYLQFLLAEKTQKIWGKYNA